MNKLLAMVGLKAVKEQALAIYFDVLSDKKLRDTQHKASCAPRSLNFLFAGNPGVGKSTVGQLFAKLLSEAGARAGGCGCIGGMGAEGSGNSRTMRIDFAFEHGHLSLELAVRVLVERMAASLHLFHLRVGARW
jgi:DNA polymerase III delta prime subunit